MNIKVDLENTYPLLKISTDHRAMMFKSPLKSGLESELEVRIDPLNSAPFTDVYNLGFGPVNAAGYIDDLASLAHKDYNKTFSTILLFGYQFLKKYPTSKLGLDGSDDRRAAVYHKMYINNKGYLEVFFKAIGVDWYVRLFRNGQYELDECQNLLPRPRPEEFNYSRTWHDLYRYYMFSLKQPFEN